MRIKSTVGRVEMQISASGDSDLWDRRKVRLLRGEKKETIYSAKTKCTVWSLPAETNKYSVYSYDLLA